MTWYLQSESIGYKLEIAWDYVTKVTFDGPFEPTIAELSEGVTGWTGHLQVEVSRCPAFFMEVFRLDHDAPASHPEGPKRPTSWRQCADFTEGQQATSIFTHVIAGPYHELRAAVVQLGNLDTFKGQVMFKDLAAQAQLQTMNALPQVSPARKDSTATSDGGELAMISLAGGQRSGAWGSPQVGAQTLPPKLNRQISASIYELGSEEEAALPHWPQAQQQQTPAQSLAQAQAQTHASTQLQQQTVQQGTAPLRQNHTRTMSFNNPFAFFGGSMAQASGLAPRQDAHLQHDSAERFQFGRTSLSGDLGIAHHWPSLQPEAQYQQPSQQGQQQQQPPPSSQAQQQFTSLQQHGRQDSMGLSLDGSFGLQWYGTSVRTPSYGANGFNNSAVYFPH